MTIAVSGVRGGHTIDFRRLCSAGNDSWLGGRKPTPMARISFAADLVDNLERGDLNLRSLLDEADTYVACNGLDLPEEAEARTIGPDSDCIANPISVLDLAKAGITTIIWATGFAADYSWIELDIFNEDEGRDISVASRRSRAVFPRPALAVATWLLVHLGRVARCQVSG